MLIFTLLSTLLKYIVVAAVDRFFPQFFSTDTPSHLQFTDRLKGGNVSVVLNPVVSIAASFFFPIRGD